MIVSKCVCLATQQSTHQNNIFRSRQSNYQMAKIQTKCKCLLGIKSRTTWNITIALAVFVCRVSCYIHANRDRQREGQPERTGRKQDMNCAYRHVIVYWPFGILES